MEAAQASQVLETDLYYSVILEKDGLWGGRGNEISRAIAD